MMDQQPDYTQYSLEELKNAAEGIDREAYPDRAALLDALIAEKEKNQHTAPMVDEFVDDTLASRGERFGAAIIDGLISLVATVPLLMYFGLERIQEPDLQLYVMSFVYSIVTLLIIHGYTLHYFAQTIGKRMMGIRIETLDGHPATLSTILYKRIIPTGLAGQLIPLLALVDVLFIFRQDRRCIHDMIAGTKVSRVPE